MKFHDPSYMIRSVPANASDSIYAQTLAQNAVRSDLMRNVIVSFVQGARCNGGLHGIYQRHDQQPLCAVAHQFDLRDIALVPQPQRQVVTASDVR